MGRLDPPNDASRVVRAAQGGAALGVVVTCDGA